MVKYYIYHIKDFKWKDGSIGKIGCTEKPKRRIVNAQGYTEYEILEEHTDIMIASQREIELQKQYGYKVDKKPYWKAIKIQTKEGSIKGGNKNVENGHIQRIQKIGCVLGGKTQGKITGKKNVESGHLDKVRKIAIQKYKKPILQYTKDGQFIKEWEGIKLAQRDTGINNIIACCKGKYQSAGGYVWKYKGE